MDLCSRQKDRRDGVVFFVAKACTRRFKFFDRHVGDDFLPNRVSRGRKIQASHVDLGVFRDTLFHVADMFALRTIFGITYPTYRQILELRGGGERGANGSELFDQPVETVPRKKAPDDVNTTNFPTSSGLGPGVAHLVHPVELDVYVVNAVGVSD